MGRLCFQTKTTNLNFCNSLNIRFSKKKKKNIQIKRNQLNLYFNINKCYYYCLITNILRVAKRKKKKKLRSSQPSYTKIWHSSGPKLFQLVMMQSFGWLILWSAASAIRTVSITQAFLIEVMQRLLVVRKVLLNIGICRFQQIINNWNFLNLNLADYENEFRFTFVQSCSHSITETIAPP